MKVYIHTDIEGVSGVVHWWNHQMWLNYSQDPLEIFDLKMRMRKLLTGEVNAAIEGALDAGAKEIVVNDSHGWGYNILLEDLNPKATLIHGEYDALPFWLPEIGKGWDAVVAVGEHAMAGTKGAVLAHSKFIWNGDIALGEIGNTALLFGTVGTPLVFASGDDMLKKEIRRLIPILNVPLSKQPSAPMWPEACIPAWRRKKYEKAWRRGWPEEKRLSLSK